MHTGHHSPCSHLKHPSTLISHASHISHPLITDCHHGVPRFIHRRRGGYLVCSANDSHRRATAPCAFTAWRWVSGLTFVTVPSASRSSISQTGTFDHVPVATRYDLGPAYAIITPSAHMLANVCEQVCQFCFNNIKNNMNGLCPACRRPYDEKTIQWKVVTSEECVLLLSQTGRHADDSLGLPSSASTYKRTKRSARKNNDRKKSRSEKSRRRIARTSSEYA